MGKSPDAFRTISEVADWLDTQAHVLRFWESKFTQVKPVKRAGGRRYYRPADMMLLGGIKKLLHDDGMTIKGAQKLLREKGTKYVSGLSQPIDDEDDSTAEIELAEVTPPPFEEERGTVLSFERRDEADDTTAETPPPETDTEDGDLFSLAAPQDPASEADLPSEDDADEALAPEDMPSFVQRLSPKPLVQQDAPAPEASKESDEPDLAPPSQEPEMISETAADLDEQDDSLDTPDAASSAQEPGPSPLAEIATMTAIAPENRAEVAALLDRLVALCKRIEIAENA